MSEFLTMMRDALNLRSLRTIIAVAENVEITDYH
jgi:hypothetical protein